VKSRKRTARVVEVRAVYEPNRIEHEALWLAYERVVPMLRRGPARVGPDLADELVSPRQAAGGARR
jgi:hypothetical protein